MRRLQAEITSGFRLFLNRRGTGVQVAIVLDEDGATSIWGKEVKTILKEAKLDLKTDSRAMLDPKKDVLDHCTGFSLSDPHNDTFPQHCDHTHEMSCPSCSQLERLYLMLLA